MRKPAFCICENKDADQLRCNREADQRLCFRYTDSIISLLSILKISSLYPSSMAVQLGNPEDRFSQNEAQIISNVIRLCGQFYLVATFWEIAAHSVDHMLSFVF